MEGQTDSETEDYDVEMEDGKDDNYDEGDMDEDDDEVEDYDEVMGEDGYINRPPPLFFFLSESTPSSSPFVNLLTLIFFNHKGCPSTAFLQREMDEGRRRNLAARCSTP